MKKRRKDERGPERDGDGMEGFEADEDGLSVCRRIRGPARRYKKACAAANRNGAVQACNPGAAAQCSAVQAAVGERALGPGGESPPRWAVRTQ